MLFQSISTISRLSTTSTWQKYSDEPVVTRISLGTCRPYLQLCYKLGGFHNLSYNDLAASCCLMRLLCHSQVPTLQALADIAKDGSQRSSAQALRFWLWHTLMHVDAWWALEVPPDSIPPSHCDPLHMILLSRYIYIYIYICKCCILSICTNHSMGIWACACNEDRSW